MALLHLLVQKNIVTSQQSPVTSQKRRLGTKDYRLATGDSTSLRLVVAHFNHGIRADSDKDEILVRDIAKEYDLPFEVGYGHLGSNASEDTARRARYQFLEAVRQKYKAKAIITAHHQDDLIETALLNIIRGTKRKGLSAIASNVGILRPLLDTPKKEILKYAQKHQLQWREDPSNLDTKILRNYLRLKIIPKMDLQQRQKILKDIDNVAKINIAVDREIAILSQSVVKNGKIERSKFALLPTEVTQELVVYWLRQHDIAQIDSHSVSRLAVFIKTGKPGTNASVKGTSKIKLEKDYARFA
ncbi:tRNA lysidine(34) synthetase TilS [Candidatus Saccharibacteria bacterium RIFCSPHIGHO2_12_FULL_47_16b]|nr:MAG: tRNA lysidine(34) synthetase TilS [Candidatus Saccharibacteria bacterium RIFCSPHIGHO2_12_FULL_47_16b]